MSELSELDEAVAKIEGWRPDVEPVSHWLMRYGHYSLAWHAGGEIIQREGIAIAKFGDEWYAMMPGNLYRGHDYIDAHAKNFDASGPTPLIAAMRAYVASKETK